MTTSPVWNGPTLRELRGEGRLLSANEARRCWKRQQRREAIAECCWLRERPWIGPLVWTGGAFWDFLSRADDASIRSAFYDRTHPLSAAQVRLARTVLYYRDTERRDKEKYF